jgi:ABC transporter substrate binding protein
VLTRYAEVKACLTDARLSSDRITPFVQHRAGRADLAAGRADLPAIETLGRTLGLWAVFTDPPKHTHLRALMNRAFTPRAVERLRPAPALDAHRDQAEPGPGVEPSVEEAALASAARWRLLKELVPKARSVAVLWNPRNAATARNWKETQEAAGSLGLKLLSVEMRTRDEVATAFAAIARERPDGLVVLLDSLMEDHRHEIVEFAAKNRLPAVYGGTPVRPPPRTRRTGAPENRQNRPLPALQPAEMAIRSASHIARFPSLNDAGRPPGTAS